VGAMMPLRENSSRSETEAMDTLQKMIKSGEGAFPLSRKTVSRHAHPRDILNLLEIKTDWPSERRKVLAGIKGIRLGRSERATSSRIFLESLRGPRLLSLLGNHL
jgi:hypothetical protein